MTLRCHLVALSQLVASALEQSENVRDNDCTQIGLGGRLAGPSESASPIFAVATENHNRRIPVPDTQPSIKAIAVSVTNSSSQTSSSNLSRNNSRSGKAMSFSIDSSLHPAHRRRQWNHRCANIHGLAGIPYGASATDVASCGLPIVNCKRVSCPSPGEWADFVARSTTQRRRDCDANIHSTWGYLWCGVNLHPNFGEARWRDTE